MSTCILLCVVSLLGSHTVLSSKPRQPIILREIRGGTNRIYTFNAAQGTDDVSALASEARPLKRKVGADFLKSVYLPKDYTTKVPEEYLRFRLLMLAQDSCSYLRGVLSTGAILKGFGVGDPSVSPLRATIQWIYRDGAAMLGGLVFSALGTFDSNVKSWRFFADCINNVGITLEMVAVTAPRHLFLPILCLGSLCRALCGVAAGAANAAISEHWGRHHGNIGDVLAKNGAQLTTLNIICLCCSVQFAAWANASQTRLWSVFTTLTAMHVALNYYAMKVLALTSINEARLDVLVRAFVDLPPVQAFLKQPPKCHTTATDNANANADLLARQVLSHPVTRDVLSSRAVARSEPIISPMLPRWAYLSLPLTWARSGPSRSACLHRRVHVYSSAVRLAGRSHAHASAVLDRVRLAREEGAHTVVVVEPVEASSRKGHGVGLVPTHVLVTKSASASEVLQATVRAYLLSGANGFEGCSAEAAMIASNAFVEVLRSLAWDLSRVQLEPRQANYLLM